MIGGIAEMTALIRELRESDPNTFLFDSGDIFTGALAKLTEGALAFELMITMGYDAMAMAIMSSNTGRRSWRGRKTAPHFPCSARTSSTRTRTTASPNRTPSSNEAVFASASSASWGRMPQPLSSLRSSRRSTSPIRQRRCGARSQSFATRSTSSCSSPSRENGADANRRGERSSTAA